MPAMLSVHSQELTRARLRAVLVFKPEVERVFSVEIYLCSFSLQQCTLLHRVRSMLQACCPKGCAAELCFMACRRVSLLGARQHRV